MNEITLKEKFDLLISKDTIDFIKKFEEAKVRMKLIEEELKEKGYIFLEENDLLNKGYEQDGIRLSYVKPSKRKQIDTQKMKDEGVYELYTVEKEYNGYTKISVSYEE